MSVETDAILGLGHHVDDTVRPWSCNSSMHVIPGFDDHINDTTLVLQFGYGRHSWLRLPPRLDLIILVCTPFLASTITLIEQPWSRNLGMDAILGFDHHVNNTTSVPHFGYGHH